MQKCCSGSNFLILPVKHPPKNQSQAAFPPSLESHSTSRDNVFAGSRNRCRKRCSENETIGAPPTTRKQGNSRVYQSAVGSDPPEAAAPYMLFKSGFRGSILISFFAPDLIPPCIRRIHVAKIDASSSILSCGVISEGCSQSRINYLTGFS